MTEATEAPSTAALKAAIRGGPAVTWEDPPGLAPYRGTGPRPCLGTDERGVSLAGGFPAPEGLARAYRVAPWARPAPPDRVAWPWDRMTPAGQATACRMEERDPENHPGHGWAVPGFGAYRAMRGLERLADGRCLDLDTGELRAIPRGAAVPYHGTGPRPDPGKPTAATVKREERRARLAQAVRCPGEDAGGCDAGPGEACQDRRGRALNRTHAARVRAWQAANPPRVHALAPLAGRSGGAWLRDPGGVADLKALLADLKGEGKAAGAPGAGA